MQAKLDATFNLLTEYKHTTLVAMQGDTVITIKKASTQLIHAYKSTTDTFNLHTEYKHTQPFWARQYRKDHIKKNIHTQTVDSHIYKSTMQAKIDETFNLYTEYKHNDSEQDRCPYHN